MKFLQRFLLVLVLVIGFGSLVAGETTAPSDSKPKTFLVFGGKTGWIGQQIVAILKDKKQIVYAAESRLEDRQAIEKEISKIHPDFIINAAGTTGRPNVDWCEDNKQATIRNNIIGALNLADVAYLHGIHMTNYGTGCIYQYDESHPMGSGIGFKETDEPNFTGSFYSKTKVMLDKLLACYDNVLNLRLRMPISDDLHPRNFITKISKYSKVINIPNSMTILDDLLPVSIEMALQHLTGNYNFTNPGTLSHNEVLGLYKEYIDPQFTWANFTIEEQNKILKSQRSNNELDVSKLLSKFPNIPPAKTSIRKVFERMRQKQNQAKL